MEGVIENTSTARDTVRGLPVLLKILPRVLLDLLVSVQSFLEPKEEKPGQSEMGRGRGIDSQYRNPGLDQSAVLHTQETILEQITFRL